ncbi:ParB N-terminal domain-containing protein [Pyrococcus abyssi]|uniref:Inosine-5'-monophosphate dehydrogenase-like protein III n=1 Tax=Pyrococcus abyssi (strain GE5 / Orsay) TaxID=272844 RepID=Q8J2X4_PYRAB|nr:ParB N-terminal domain-containing protein [Pyrococcus abyssi]CAD55665.1 Predicted transcriptional regulators [Pyrococcus abyssi GE5]CCE70240.1 TPA: inosine-5'-monophosphate dehydrogenase-like protein III [Pyrococcus abyssi GE5]
MLDRRKFEVVIEETVHGYDAPVIVLKYRGKYFLLDGHHRVLARKVLKLDFVEALVLEPLEPVDIKIEESVKRQRIRSIDDIIVK